MSELTVEPYDMSIRRQITRDDLAWWLDTAAHVEWIFATTYARTAPHSYVVLGRTHGMTRQDYVRAGRVIRTFGQPAKFFSATNVYLTSPDGRLKWWTMDADVRETDLINQATTDRAYGVQNAPATWSGVETTYDAIATFYDELHPSTPQFREDVLAAVAALRGDFPPAVLDVGCGTGRVLDLSVTTPDRYAGVDPSTPMLNHLVLKHPAVAAVYPTTIARILAAATFTGGQFEVVTALLNGHETLARATLERLTRIASRGLVLARGDELTVVESQP